MGFGVLGEVIARVSGKPCREFLQVEFFDPMGMKDTTLGVPDGWFEGPNPKVNRIAEVRVPDEQQDARLEVASASAIRGVGRMNICASLA